MSRRVREFYPGLMIEFPADADAPAAGSSAALQFSDDAGTAPTSKAIRVKQAALNRGMSEGDLALRLREGKAKLAVRDGHMYVKYDDLLELTRRGKVPKANSSTADREAADARDVEARTNAVAESIGLDLAPPSDPSKPAKHETETAAATSSPDPAVEARTAAVASAIGLPSESVQAPQQQEPPQQAADATTQVVKAGHTGRRTRFGRPLRWGERL